MFQRKIAFVTGSARGIGLAISQRFAKEGAGLVMIDTNPLVAESLEMILRTEPQIRGLALVADVRDSTQVREAMHRTSKELGTINFLINNAAILVEKLVEQMSDEEWDQIMDINAGGVFRCCREVLRYMIPNRSGRIVNIASQIGKISEPYNAAYGASKAAVIRFSQALAMEVAQHGINVNTICPGITATEMIKKSIVERAAFEGVSPKEYETRLCATIPLRRMADPSDIAGLATFLCGPDSSYMTGQAINISGGRTTV